MQIESEKGEFMKNVFCITVVLTWLLILFPAVQVSAGFSLPDDAYRMSELKNDIENAIEDDWPLSLTTRILPVVLLPMQP